MKKIDYDEYVFWKWAIYPDMSYHQRLGQAFINEFFHEIFAEPMADPSLYYETDNEKAIGLILEKYVEIDNV